MASAVHNIRRYAAYFHGWATAFGNHDKHLDEEQGLSWLLGEEQIGLILTPRVRAFLSPLFLSNREAGPPPVALGPEGIRIADTAVRFGSGSRLAFDTVMDLLQGKGDLHLLQTYHVIYPSGTRILTLSRHSPLALVYREIEPMTLRLVQTPA
ncbi:MAG: hypothetical protein LGR52_10580 [Candidatus Thiosymbion ectosymbiont of Robbea hypermnestra]|nr:hypothetical protein [Candidatus Thiosymbion ectosymbiont of Robbea hypermnestra]